MSRAPSLRRLAALLATVPALAAPLPAQGTPTTGRITGRVVAAQTGAPLAAAGIVVFSKLCTHAGCPVGLYEQTAHQLFCPCHQSVFDVIEAGRVLGGPAARPLPQLPVGIDGQGYVVADGDFHGQVGPTYWRRE
jgi:Rieske Fe-S protein